MTTEEMVGAGAKFNGRRTEKAVAQLLNGATRRTVHKRGLPDADWTTAEAAIFYAVDLGWFVFPADPATKRPRIREWQHIASRDAEQIERWWRQWPDAMIGGVCGPASGFSVLDVDAKADGQGLSGLNHLDELENERGSLGRLPTVYTPGGGIHLFFAAESLPFEKSEDRVAPKIDVRSARADGSGAGYVILPPSKNTGGRQYRWHETTLEAVASLPVAPAWLAGQACFKPDERDKLKRDRTLQRFIEKTPRAEWRATFEAYKDTAQRLSELERFDALGKRSEGFSLSDPYITRAIEQECKAVVDCDSAQNAQLNSSSFALGRLLAGAGLAREGDTDADNPNLRAVRQRLFEAAMKMRVLDPSTPWNDREGQKRAQATIESGLRAGLGEPRDLSCVTKRSDRDANGQSDGRGTQELRTVRMSDVKMTKLEPLWQPFVMNRKITMIAGEPGQGKSQVTLDMAARVTTGEEFRTLEIGAAKPRAPGSVLIIACEDGVGDTMVPRLTAAGANLERIHLIEGKPKKLEDGTTTLEPISLQNSLAALDRKLTEIGDVRLIIIDPISAYMGRADSHKNAEVRAVLAPLGDLAEKHSCAIVIVTHLNKGGGRHTTHALHRVTDSLGFTAAARSVLLVTKDPTDEEEPDKRLLTIAKSNLSKDQGGLEFFIRDVHLEGGYPTTRIEWGKASVVSAMQAINGQGAEDRDALDDAKDFLSMHLSDGPVKEDELRKRAKRDEISWASIRRAKKSLDVKSEKHGFGEDGYWEWTLPAPPPAEASCQPHAPVTAQHERLREKPPRQQ